MIDALKIEGMIKRDRPWIGILDGGGRRRPTRAGRRWRRWAGAGTSGTGCWPRPCSGPSPRGSPAGGTWRTDRSRRRHLHLHHVQNAPNQNHRSDRRAPPHRTVSRKKNSTGTTMLFFLNRCTSDNVQRVREDHGDTHRHKTGIR